ncbi:hypothetical protein [Pedobacter sp. MC2016-24]|uniref:hypothetical protein n=1 Tax=Pedobacter sp. MC2016-24 TaxID=2780090 RepID=UPI001880CECC|nr:hypothetical protein [Pedobacter sp. MC2016-24]MBE9599868.1 hypothetical protein [Pedobacter sp. MC2016-24]
MKALHQFCAIDSAKLLHQLFPDEIPAFLEFVWNLCPTIRESERRNRDTWEDKDYPFDLFFKSLFDVEKAIAANPKGLAFDPELFSSELFRGEIPRFMVYCFNLYTKVKQHPNPKFTQAVNLLFNC